MRPIGYLKNTRSSIKQIYEALKYRLNNYKWPSFCSRQKGGHWLRRFISRLRFPKGYAYVDSYNALEEYFLGGLKFLEL